MSEGQIDANQQIEGTPLIFLAIKEEYLDIVQLLINFGANLDSKNKDGFSVITYAITNQLWQSAELLMKYSPKPWETYLYFYNGSPSKLEKIDKK